MERNVFYSIIGILDVFGNENSWSDISDFFYMDAVGGGGGDGDLSKKY